MWTFPDDPEGHDVSAVFFRTLLGLSDVLSIHCYCEPEELEIRLEELSKQLGRPVLVTEFMARPMNSTLENSLPVLRRTKSWGYTWGLFRGKSQTHLPWSTWAGDIAKDDVPWFHDIFHDTGEVYNEAEIKELWWHTVGTNLAI
eukprot:TRINITY_DN57802_c0_g1_i2.p5 TRINITY_DN57802_c0_g1~~TRINITY_DN57802_c0_g1_i2.p5  ORF type:complete len:144 (+),score=22.07 TRINITY_DN57802_c0_g1_i2:1712-2143(+)